MMQCNHPYGLHRNVLQCITANHLPPQAWRAVDRAYVDKNFNDQSWFRVSEFMLPLNHQAPLHAAKLARGLNVSIFAAHADTCP